MIIPIRLPHEVPPPNVPLPPILASLGANEIVLVELQGSIETEGAYGGEAVATLDMAVSSKPTLRVGHHLLEGKIASLSKPLAVLKSVPSAQEGATSPISFDMVAIIRKKIVFAKRPSPIVTQVAEVQEPTSKKRLKPS